MPCNQNQSPNWGKSDHNTIYMSDKMLALELEFVLHNFFYLNLAECKWISWTILWFVCWLAFFFSYPTSRAFIYINSRFMQSGDTDFCCSPFFFLNSFLISVLPSRIVFNAVKTSLYTIKRWAENCLHNELQCNAQAHRHSAYRVATEHSARTHILLAVLARTFARCCLCCVIVHLLSFHIILIAHR